MGDEELIEGLKKMTKKLEDPAYQDAGASSLPSVSRR